MSEHVHIGINHFCKQLYSMTDNPKQIIYWLLAVESEETLIVDSVAAHETSGQIPKGYSQQKDSFKMDVFMMMAESLNFSPCEFGSSFVGSLDNGFLILQNCILYFLSRYYKCYDIFIENFRASFLYITEFKAVHIFVPFQLCKFCTESFWHKKFIFFFQLSSVHALIKLVV